MRQKFSALREHSLSMPLDIAQRCWAIVGGA